VEFVRGATNHKGWFTYTELDYDCIVLDCWHFSAKVPLVAGKSRTASRQTMSPLDVQQIAYFNWHIQDWTATFRNNFRIDV